MKHRKHYIITFLVYRLQHTAGLPTERGGISGGTAVLIPPGWRLDKTEEIIPGRAVLAVIQDRYSTIGLDISLSCILTAKEASYASSLPG